MISNAYSSKIQAPEPTAVVLQQARVREGHGAARGGRVQQRQRGARQRQRRRARRRRAPPPHARALRARAPAPARAALQLRRRRAARRPAYYESKIQNLI